MDILREFFESSTIHGVAHISAAKSKPAKILWALIVCLGFVGAGILIGKSYMEWQENPVSTSITTHPIDDLDLPKVTICPPKDSNTALYHDLVKAGNGTLSEDNKEILRTAAYQIFMEQPHKVYVDKMMATLHMGNIDQMLQGFHSIPKPYKHANGFEVRMWNLNGTITSPWYGSEFFENYYREDHDLHVVLEIPQDIKDLVGSGSLVVELETDIQEKAGWHEELKYAGMAPPGYVWSDFGYAYKLYTKEKSLSAAEAECQKGGSHLASVASEEANEELRIKAIHGGASTIWLGGARKSGEWSWSDNSSWGYSKWKAGIVMRGKSSYFMKMNTSSGEWSPSPASSWAVWQKSPFVCQIAMPVLVGKQRLSFWYNKKQLTPASIHVWYMCKAVSQHLLDNWGAKKMTGFRFSWRIENESPPLITNITEVGRSVQTPSIGYVDHKHTSILTMPQNNVGNISLIIDLNVQMTNASGLTDKLVAFTDFQLYELKKTFNDAEAHCRNEGGQLASIHSQWEQTLAEKASDGNAVWLGGRKSANKWGWIDNSTWEFSNWESIRTSGQYLLMGAGGHWMETKSTGSGFFSRVEEHFFLCQAKALTLTKSGSRSFEFKQTQPKFFHLLFQGQTDEGLFNFSSEVREQRNSGFTLNWFLKDINGSRLTEELPPRAEDWKRETPTPSHKQPLLNEMVELAQHLRIKQNKTGKLIFEEVIQGKMKNIKILETPGWCEKDQIKPYKMDEAFLDLVSPVEKNDLEDKITKEDYMTGFEIFHGAAYCPVNDIKFFRFIDQMLSEESKRTIIQTFVNLFHSEVAKDPARLKMAQDFYLDLAAVLDLQYGSVLLSTSSKAQLQTVIDNEWPFFTNNTDLVKDCLLHFNCGGVQDILQRLDTEGVSREISLHPVHLTPDVDGNLPPSALVPFCSYQEDASLLGQERPESGNLTFCNKFEPTILEGQLCYSLDVAKFKRKPTKAGKKSGLFLLIDPIPNVVAPRNDQELFIVYVHTLAQHTSFGPGVYSMHILKKMTGTKSFLKLQDNQKNCQVNDQEMCQTKNFLDGVKERCNCVPWPVAPENNNNEEFSICGPQSEICVANQTIQDDTCLVPCSGLYADVWDDSRVNHRVMAGFRSFNDHLGQMEGLSHLQEREFTSTDWQGGRGGHSAFRKEYQKYKEEYVKQLQFGSESYEHSPLEEVYIFFDTTTYDEIERDVKVTMEAALGLIGGTMGLLTGFSILSGIEILYYIVRFFISLKVSNTINKRSNHQKRNA